MVQVLASVGKLWHPSGYSSRPAPLDSLHVGGASPEDGEGGVINRRQEHSFHVGGELLLSDYPGPSSKTLRFFFMVGHLRDPKGKSEV